MRLINGNMFSNMWSDTLSTISYTTLGGSGYKYQGERCGKRITLRYISIDYIKRK